jgi:hypothetical protein
MALALTVVCLFTMKAHAGPDGCDFVYRGPTPPGFQLSVEELTQFLFHGFALEPLRALTSR